MDFYDSTKCLIVGTSPTTSMYQLKRDRERFRTPCAPSLAVAASGWMTKQPRDLLSWKLVPDSEGAERPWPGVEAGLTASLGHTLPLNVFSLPTHCPSLPPCRSQLL